MSSARHNLPRAPVHDAFTRHFLMKGAERTPAMVSAIFSLYMTFLITMRFAIWYGIPVGLVLWTVCIEILRRMAKADPQMCSVFFRHIKYKSFYPARGRFNARTKLIRGFR